MPQEKTTLKRQGLPPMGRSGDMDLSHFKTPHNLPFLFLLKGEDIDPISLNLDHMPIVDELPFGLWTTYKTKTSKIYIANAIRNEVARGSRRAVGNIIFLSTNSECECFKEQFASYGHSDIKFVVDSQLYPNEIRSTYWKILYRKIRVGDEIIETDEPVAIDGGIQLSPDGISCIYNIKGLVSDYTKYFVKGFYE